MFLCNTQKIVTVLCKDTGSLQQSPFLMPEGIDVMVCSTKGQRKPDAMVIARETEGSLLSKMPRIQVAACR